MKTKTATTLEHIRGEHRALTADTAARLILSSTIEPADPEAGKLVATLGVEETVSAIFDSEDDRVSDTLRTNARRAFNPDKITTQNRNTVRFNATFITPEHEHWPTRMNDLGDLAPFALWVRGDSSLLVDKLVSTVVGARAATGYGEHVTMEMAAGLVDRGHTIASGAAYGIDGMAHRATLAASGRTVAYLAGGVDRFYPSGHESLLTRVVEMGAVVSELPCGSPPTKWRFLARNRMLGANTGAVILVEAGWRSGSLSTAHHASTIGRPVGAIPGPVTSAASAGCHRLIREGIATLISNADEAAELQQ